MDIATASQYRIGTRVLILSNEFHEMTYDGEVSTAASSSTDRYRQIRADDDLEMDGLAAVTQATTNLVGNACST